MGPCIEFSLEIPQILSLTVFLLSISLIISRRLEESHAALLGVALILILGVADLYKAFSTYVDWNVISILLGMWMISFYMSDSGLIDLLIRYMVKRTNNIYAIVIYLNLLAGLITMFVDNVLVVLLLVPIAMRLLRLAGVDPAKPSIMIALSANFMGTALLLGDLPPQLLHVIFGAEFIDFIFMQGRPASFPILTISFIITIILSSRILLRELSRRRVNVEILSSEWSRVYDKRYVATSLISFISVIILMALRRSISDLVGYDIKLGVFPLLIATLVAVYLVASKRVSFEKVVEEGIDLNAILFYIGLFILVGSLEETGLLDILARELTPLLSSTLYVGYTVVYWISASIVAFVEHDAYILIMLKTFKHLYIDGVLNNPWPYNWALLFSGTLGSNYTAAGAPALYVAFRLLERDLSRRLTLREIYATTVTYSTISLVACYLISVVVWGF
ncbi:MAG: SLC13 family permease [Sulfolobales archaeon]